MPRAQVPNGSCWMVRTRPSVLPFHLDQPELDPGDEPFVFGGGPYGTKDQNLSTSSLTLSSQGTRSTSPRLLEFKASASYAVVVHDRFEMRL